MLCNQHPSAVLYIRLKWEVVYFRQRFTDITKEVKMKPVDRVYPLFLSIYMVVNRTIVGL